MLCKSCVFYSLLLISSIASVSAATAGDYSGVSLKDDHPGFSWTGLYVGVHGGWADYKNDFPGLAEHPVGPPDPDLSGAFVGGQVTGLYQFDHVVIGAVADISFTDVEDTVRDGNFITQETKLDRFGTVRGVLGFSVGRFLPYATAGWAWADASYTERCPDGAAFGFCRPFANGGAGPYNVKGDDTLDGWAYGAGLKYAISDHFTIGIEYLRLDLDEGLFILPALANGKNPSDKPFDLDADSVKVAVDFKF